MHSQWPLHQYCLSQQLEQPSGTDDLLPRLADISHKKKGWVLLIAPPGGVSAKTLHSKGIDPRYVLVIGESRVKDWQRTLETSLGNGCFSAVISWLPAGVCLDHRKLEQASRRSGALAHFVQPVLPMPLNFADQPLFGCH
ncbi:hypothetical protein [Aeromonas simiae]|uniref:hypothetical protein n=1 Tax=Aeromonas simiae TaxID=218936 RepID=UPI000693647D|nr:hypothetical protein [Aeromonas simiae]